VGLKGAEHLEAVVVEENGAQRTIETDYFIPLFGLTPKWVLLETGDWKSKKYKSIIHWITKPIFRNIRHR
jgi:thioredoxin reductase (NADPH)